MKIAISSEGKKIEDEIAENFGRCPYFIFLNINCGDIAGYEAVKNNNQNQKSGAGVTVAQMVAKRNVDAVIAGSVGPRAEEVLKQLNIKIYPASGPVKEAIKKIFP